jgi:hypothetical protein
MVISMPPNYTYTYIKDDLVGQISFLVLKGELFIDILDSQLKTSYTLRSYDILYLNRNIYRQTRTADAGCLYCENLSGGFNPSSRRKFN